MPLYGSGGLNDLILETTIPIQKGVLDSVKNDPRILVDSESQGILAELVSGLSFEQTEELFILLKQALNGAIGDVFIVSFAILILSLGISMLLNQKGFTR